METVNIREFRCCGSVVTKCKIILSLCLMSILISSPIFIYVSSFLFPPRLPIPRLPHPRYRSACLEISFIFIKFEWGGATRCTLYTKATIMMSVAEADVNLNILDEYSDIRGLYLAFEDIRNVSVHLENKIITKARPNLVCRPKIKSDINLRSLYYFHDDCDVWSSFASICSLFNKIK